MGRSSKEVSYKIKSPHCCGPSKVFSSRPTKFLPQVNKLFKKHVKFTFSPSELNTDYDILEIRKILESGKMPKIKRKRKHKSRSPYSAFPLLLGTGTEPADSTLK